MGMWDTIMGIGKTAAGFVPGGNMIGAGLGVAQGLAGNLLSKDKVLRSEGRDLKQAEGNISRAIDQNANINPQAIAQQQLAQLQTGQDQAGRYAAMGAGGRASGGDMVNTNANAAMKGAAVGQAMAPYSQAQAQVVGQQGAAEQQKAQMAAQMAQQQAEITSSFTENTVNDTHWSQGLLPAAEAGKKIWDNINDTNKPDTEQVGADPGTIGNGMQQMGNALGGGNGLAMPNNQNAMQGNPGGTPQPATAGGAGAGTGGGGNEWNIPDLSLAYNEGNDPNAMGAGGTSMPMQGNVPMSMQYYNNPLLKFQNNLKKFGGTR